MHEQFTTLMNAPMQVCGDRFPAPASGDYGPYGSGLIVRGRILSQADYLEALQERLKKTLAAFADGWVPIAFQAGKQDLPGAPA